MTRFLLCSHQTIPCKYFTTTHFWQSLPEWPPYLPTFLQKFQICPLPGKFTKVCLNLTVWPPWFGLLTEWPPILEKKNSHRNTGPLVSSRCHTEVLHFHSIQFKNNDYGKTPVGCSLGIMLKARMWKRLWHWGQFHGKKRQTWSKNLATSLAIRYDCYLFLRDWFHDDGQRLVLLILVSQENKTSCFAIKKNSWIVFVTN